ncbi:MAG: epoxide hydrolase [Alphaproteobacteria bacterium]|nr:epoxide hydrolase [Alphaproteobacteria bacterium]
MPSLEPFRIDVAEEVLDDLRRRLAATRWPGEADDAAWQYGANLGYMKRLVAYWLEGYDWRRAEAELNRFDHFMAPLSDPELGDFRIHLVREAGDGENPIPLLVSHGWPGSFHELLGLVGPLAHPDSAGGAPAFDVPSFDVIVPSLPGYGFSSGLSRPIGPRAIARLWRRLMTEVLDYERFAAQGGDWGAMVSSWLGFDHADVVDAIHLNMIAFRPWLGPGSEPLSAEEAAWVRRVKGRLGREGAYQRIQATKPATLAFGLTDSPAGLAAWIVEKFHGWSGAPAETEPPFTMDQLITNVMIYWVTGTINTANWIYRAVGDEGLGPDRDARVEVPTGFALFPKDLFPPCPQSWLERAYNVVHRTDMAEGGHFAALENGPALVADIRTFFAALGR